MAISTNNFKNGMCIMHDDKMWTIVEFQHVKPGKGGAFVRTKLKEVKSGRVVDVHVPSGREVRRRSHGDQEDAVPLQRRLHVPLHGQRRATSRSNSPGDVVGDGAQWLKENDEVEMLYAGGEIIGVEPPMFVELEVTETDPGFKGDTVQGGTKPATLETGAVVQVPMFVETGDMLKIDTRDGRYITRVVGRGGDPSAAPRPDATHRASISRIYCSFWHFVS